MLLRNRNRQPHRAEPAPIACTRRRNLRQVGRLRHCRRLRRVLSFPGRYRSWSKEGALQKHLAAASGLVASFRLDWRRQSRHLQPSRLVRRLQFRGRALRSHTAASRRRALTWQLSSRWLSQARQSCEPCATGIACRAMRRPPALQIHFSSTTRSPRRVFVWVDCNQRRAQELHPCRL